MEWKRKTGQWPMETRRDAVLLLRRSTPQSCVWMCRWYGIVYNRYSVADHHKVRAVAVIHDLCPLCCVDAETYGSFRRRRRRHQNQRNSGRRRLCVWAPSVPAAPCLWDTSWDSVRMNSVSRGNLYTFHVTCQNILHWLKTNLFIYLIKNVILRHSAGLLYG